MTVSEIRNGIGLIPPDPEKGKIDLEKLIARTEEIKPLKPRFGREGNSYIIPPVGESINLEGEFQSQE